MPKPVDYDLGQIDAHIIAYSDRVQRGTKEDRATPACVGALTAAGLGEVTMAAIPESADVLETEIRDALEVGAASSWSWAARASAWATMHPRSSVRSSRSKFPASRSRSAPTA